jgi:hypothetical protein
MFICINNCSQKRNTHLLQNKYIFHKKHIVEWIFNKIKFVFFTLKSPFFCTKIDSGIKLINSKGILKFFAIFFQKKSQF